MVDFDLEEAEIKAISAIGLRLGHFVMMVVLSFGMIVTGLASGAFSFCQHRAAGFMRPSHPCRTLNKAAESWLQLQLLNEMLLCSCNKV